MRFSLVNLQADGLSFARHMIPRNKRGAVTIALGHEGLLKLRQAAKLTKHKPAAVAKALIFSGIDSVLNGELKIETKPRLSK
jgi:hypothetical protein